MTDDHWRKVSEEMPEAYEDVLCVDANRHRSVGWRAAYDKGEWEWHSFDN